MLLTQDYIKELFDYDPLTGIFRARLYRGKNAKKAGQIVGRRKDGKYASIWIDGVTYKVHRLAWLYVYGQWPKEQLDHINGDPSDNKISNLREATQSQNKVNSRVYRNNKLGVKGVRQCNNGHYEARCSKFPSVCCHREFWFWTNMHTVDVVFRKNTLQFNIPRAVQLTKYGQINQRTLQEWHTIAKTWRGLSLIS